MKIPAGGRAQCGRPAPFLGVAPTPGSKLTFRAVEVRNISVRLSFAMWDVVLGAVDAHGTVEAVRAIDGSAWILFDMREVLAANGGSLRVGPAGVTPAVTFDRVDIPPVAATSTAPQDVLLEVEAGRTTGAVLSGRATFADVFAPDTWHAPAGMDLEARWTADRAVKVEVPRIPDVTIDAGCLVEGPLTAPVITGQVKGHNLYSRAALAIGDWFTTRNLRGCDLAPRPQPR